MVKIFFIREDRRPFGTFRGWKGVPSRYLSLLCAIGWGGGSLAKSKVILSHVLFGCDIVMVDFLVIVVNVAVFDRLLARTGRLGRGNGRAQIQGQVQEHVKGILAGVLRG